MSCEQEVNGQIKKNEKKKNRKDDKPCSFFKEVIAFTVLDIKNSDLHIFLFPLDSFTGRLDLTKFDPSFMQGFVIGC